MPFPLASALSLLFIFSHLAPVAHAGNSRYYIVEQRCKGGNYVDFDIKEVNKCYRLGSGTAGSLYSKIPGDLNMVRAYKRKHESDCGEVECIISPGGSCCSSKHRRITGAQLNQIIVPCQPLSACIRNGGLELEEQGGGDNCTLVDDIGEPFIELSDGTHFGLGVGKLGKLTAEELQGDLEAKGKDRLSGEKIAELLEIRFIKGE
ncbi:hypothetical protein V8C37DRAFT_11215 [Trichoderma ceciliae]